MTLRWAFVSFVHLLVVFACIGAGLLSLAVVYKPEVRIYLAEQILFHQDWALRLGAAFFALAAALLFLFFLLHRGKFIRFTMGRNVTELTGGVIRKTVRTFFKKSYPQLSLVDLDITKKSLLEMRVAVRRPEGPEQVEKLLEQVETDLAALFHDRFGYKRSFVLSVDAQLFKTPK